MSIVNVCRLILSVVATVLFVVSVFFADVVNSLYTAQIGWICLVLWFGLAWLPE